MKTTWIFGGLFIFPLPHLIKRSEPETLEKHRERKSLLLFYSNCFRSERFCLKSLFL
ncbi:BnaA08g14570D [Brassica napus]|uniref:BnaA08g14570D protein n=1 Tax=Brassica napus TaxID=3708 RepID=A0A078GJS0_BRANA|nr:BnaA08g14570D [Brassica napus]